MHIEMVINGIEQAIDEETKIWLGAKESYRLSDNGELNVLEIEIDIMGKHLEFMKDKFPIALEQIKTNCR